MRRLSETHGPQRETAVGTLHGIYCDRSSNEESRLNSLDVCRGLAAEFTPGIRSTLINRHSDYIAAGKDDRKQASQKFFEELGLLGLLSNPEQHSIFSRAASRLVSVHQGYDNFYNEPPFAERLLELSQQTAVPPAAQREFVEATVMCAIGSRYGVSNRAEPTYHAIVKNFSPQEVAYMLQAPAIEPSVIRRRVTGYSNCRTRFRALVDLLDPSTVPASAKAQYDWWLAR